MRERLADAGRSQSLSSQRNPKNEFVNTASVRPKISSRTPLQNILAGALIIIVALVPVSVQAVMVAHTDFLLDYGAFYCGARAVLHGSDPYRTEPLRSCE